VKDGWLVGWLVGWLPNPTKLVDVLGVDCGAEVAALKENGFDGADPPKPEDEKLKPVEPLPPKENGFDAV
jgi:hypothetical protein